MRNKFKLNSRHGSFFSSEINLEEIKLKIEYIIHKSASYTQSKELYTTTHVELRGTLNPKYINEFQGYTPCRYDIKSISMYLKSRGGIYMYEERYISGAYMLPIEDKDLIVNDIISVYRLPCSLITIPLWGYLNDK